MEGEWPGERGVTTDSTGLIVATQRPAVDQWVMNGYAFYNNSFSQCFKGILEEVWNTPGTESLYWEQIYAANVEKLPLYAVKYTDKEVMEFSYALPHSYKYENGNKKRILKALAYDYIPKELLERPKVGFSVPLDKWLRGPLKEQLLDYCNQDFLRKQDIFKGDEVEKFMKHYLETGDGGRGTGANYSRMVWAYFVFQKWYRQYM